MAGCLEPIVNNRYFAPIIAVLTLVAYCTSCSPDNGTVSRDYASLIDNLQEARALVEPRGEVASSLLSGHCSEVGVNDSIITVWEFDDDAAADAQTTGISGCAVRTATGLTLFEPVASPHWYKAGKLIVLYVGESEDVITVLEKVLGPQFAPA